MKGDVDGEGNGVWRSKEMDVKNGNTAGWFSWFPLQF